MEYFRRNEDCFNCFCVVAGKNATTTGKVIVAHNEDDAVYNKVYRGYVPPCDWPDGTLIPAEEGLAKIPQVKHTLGYHWTEVKAAMYGLPNADGYFNDAGVLLVSNSTAQSREPLDDPSIFTDGGIAGNLRRVVAERSATAREALEVARTMVETYGYAARGRCYTFADKDEVYMMQITRGKHYLAVRVPDDMVAVMPNHYTLHGLKDFPEMFYPADLISYAIEKGWYMPENPDNFDDFDFAKVYADEQIMHQAGNINRAKYAFVRLLDGHFGGNGEGLPYSNWTPDGENPPFGCRLDRKVSPYELGRMMADHYEGSVDNAELFGPGKSPHHPGIRRICTESTIDSVVCEFSENSLLTRLWICPGRPCSLPFMPTHPAAGMAQALFTMEKPSVNAEIHYLPAPEKLHYVPTVWQHFRDYQEKLDMLYCDVIGGCSELLEKMYAEDEENCVAAEKMALNLIAAGREKEALFLLRNADNRLILNDLAKLQEYGDINFNVCEADVDPLKFADITEPTLSKTTARVSFTCACKPVEGSLIFGLAGLNIRTTYENCVQGSLESLGGGHYTAAFSIVSFANELRSPGIYACMLGGNEECGRAFTSLVMLVCK